MVKGFHGAAKPISIGAFAFCTFTITALSDRTLHELLVDFLARLQAKFLRFFGFNGKEPRMTRIALMLGSAERGRRERRQNSQNQQNESPKLKLAPSPRSLTATLAALPSISEIPFLDSVHSVEIWPNAGRTLPRAQLR